MKTRIIYMLIGSLLYHTSHAEVSSSNEFFTAYQLSQVSGLANSINQYEPSRDCRRPKTLRQYPYEKQTIPNRS